MKKILTLFLAITMIMSLACFSVSATGSAPITLELTFNPDGNTLTATGYVVSARDRIPMFLIIESDNNDPTGASDTVVDVKSTLAVGHEGPNVPYTFPTVQLPNNLPGGTLTATVSANWLNVSATDSYTYVGAVDQLLALQNLNSYSAAENTAAYETELLANDDLLGLDTTTFTDMGETASAAVLRNLMSVQYTLPTNSIENLTDEDCLTIKEAVSTCYTQFQEAMALGTFFDCDTTEKLAAWYNTYKGTYGFEANVPGTTVDETKFLSYYNEAMASAAFLGRSANVSDVTTVAELNLAMKDQALLHAVEHSGQVIIHTLLEDFEEHLTLIDYTAWDGLSIEKQNEVCQLLTGENFATISAFCEFVNSSIEEVEEADDDDDDDDGYRGGGGKDKPIGIGQQLVDDTKPMVSQVFFTDISDVTWAKDAIVYLQSKGVVSGRTAETFDPNAQVTRAELLKMLVAGFKLTGSSDARFGDVSADAWYADYVAIGAANGLITGDENGNFNPNQAVSRQDAAVLMYRALNPSESAAKASFVDYGSISEYANTAVNYMYEKGVINGVGDGCFAPLAELSRAQAAKMLYYMLQQ
ncbi:MAG: S-layer homology domain-containing protein [Ruminococcaceae bacterium]|nr:S-layer homology domain-containing protein [Oscillospiraceae bacterium]